MGIPQSSAVEVIANAVLSAQLPHCEQLFERLDRAATKVVGVLDRDRRGGYQVRTGRGRNDLRQLGKLHFPASGGKGSHGHPLQSCVCPHLCSSDMSLYVTDHFLAGFDEQPNPEHVAH